MTALTPESEALLADMRAVNRFWTDADTIGTGKRLAAIEAAAATRWKASYERLVRWVADADPSLLDAWEWTLNNENRVVEP